MSDSRKVGSTSDSFDYKIPEEVQIRMDVEYCLYWLQATRYQGERVLQAHSSLTQYNGVPFHTVKTMEEQFFLNALSKAILWAKKLMENDIASDDISALINAAPDGKHIRNKREHDEEHYGTQAGHEPLLDLSGPDSKVTIHGTPSVTVIRNGKILIGGQVDVHETMTLCEKVAVILLEMQHAHWDKKWFDPGPCFYKAPARLIGPEDV